MINCRRWLATAAVVALSASLTGCAGANRGGDTTCKDYLAMSKEDQIAVIKKHYSDQGRSSLTNGQITLARASATLYCKTVGTDQSRIKEIDG